MGLISRVSSRTYRNLLISLTHPFIVKMADRESRTIFCRNLSWNATQDMLFAVPQFQNAAEIKIPTDRKPADHEDSVLSNSTPLKNANKLCKQLKASKLTDEKSFSLKVNHEKLKAAAEVVTADEVADEVEVVTKEETAVSKLRRRFSIQYYMYG